MLEVPFPGVAAALAQGRIDAALLVEPFTSAAGGQVKILGDAQAAIGRGYMVTGWYAKTDWLNANRDTARKFVDVMIQTAKWGNKNHDQSAAILAKYIGMTPEVIRATPRAYYGETPITPDDPARARLLDEVHRTREDAGRSAHLARVSVRGSSLRNERAQLFGVDDHDVRGAHVDEFLIPEAVERAVDGFARRRDHVRHFLIRQGAG